MTIAIEEIKPEAELDGIERKAVEAADIAQRLYHELNPDASDYEYSDDSPDTVQEWEATLGAMTAAGQREYEEYAKWLPAEYERQSRREEHFRRLIAQEKELAAGLVHYPPTEYLVDGWLPTKEIHLLIGESGAGKTTWLFSEFLAKWQREEPILGKASHYVPYAVLVNDRSDAGIVRTLERMRLHPGYPIKSINGDPRPLDVKVTEFCDANPHVRFLVIEGIHCGMEDLNDYSAVSKLMAGLVKLCRERDLTILGTTHVSKAAASNGVNGRTSAIGSVATAGMSETLMVLSRKGSTVNLTINDHNGPEFNQSYAWTPDGYLKEIDAIEAEGFPTGRMADFLAQNESDTFRRSDYLDFMRDKGKSEQQGYTDIRNARIEGWIVESEEIKSLFQIIKRPAGWEARTFKNG